MNPDGIMLSNGPGNPEDNPEIIEEIRKITKAGKPMFGICLGHQLLAIAKGAKTGKMKFGHRGANQPVKDLTTGRVYISSQNHGYEVLRHLSMSTTAPARASPTTICRHLPSSSIQRRVQVRRIRKSCLGVSFR